MRGDMAPRNDRSIRNIPVSSIHKKRQTRFEAQEYEEEEQEQPRRPRRRKKGSRIFWVSAVLLVLVFAAIGVVLSAQFGGGSVVVSPRTAPHPATLSLQASPNAPAGSFFFFLQTVTS